MTDLTSTPEGQSSDPMGSDSETGDIRPDPKRHRTRRRRWYLLTAIPVMLLTLMVCAAATLSGGSCTLGGIGFEVDGVFYPAKRWTGVRFHLTPFLGDRAITLGEAKVMPVDVRACVRERYSGLRYAMAKPSGSCASFTVYAPPDHEFVWVPGEVDPWDPRGVFIEDPPLTLEQPIAVRLTMRDQAGNSIFDSSAVVQADWVPLYCASGGYQAHVVATRFGRLAPYKVWEPNS